MPRLINLRFIYLSLSLINTVQLHTQFLASLFNISEKKKCRGRKSGNTQIVTLLSSWKETQSFLPTYLLAVCFLTTRGYQLEMDIDSYNFLFSGSWKTKIACTNGIVNYALPFWAKTEKQKLPPWISGFLYENTRIPVLIFTYLPQLVML